MKARLYIFFSLILLLQSQTILPGNDFLGNIDEGIDTYEQAIRYKDSGEYADAIRVFEKFLETLPESSKKKAYVLHQLGLLYWNIGDLQACIDNLELSLAYAKQANDVPLIDRVQASIKIYDLYQKAKISRDNSLSQEAIDLFNKCIELSKDIEGKEFELKTLRQLAYMHWSTGNFKEYFELNKRALALAESLKHTREEAYCRNNIGLFFWKTEDYSRALDSFSVCLQLTNKLQDLEAETDCLNNIGLIYQELGDFDNSFRYHMKALENDRIAGHSENVVIDLLNIGVIFRQKYMLTGDSSDFNNALKYLTDAESGGVSTDNKKLRIKALNNIGSLYSDKKEYFRASEYFNQALSLAQATSDSEAESTVLNNLGIIHYHLGNYHQSVDMFNKSIALAIQINKGQILWEALLELGNSHLIHDNLLEAEKNFRKSISVIEDIRSSINLEEYRASYLGTDKRLEPYHNLIHALLTRNQRTPAPEMTAEAFHILEKAKARSFLDSMEIAEVDLSLGVNVKLASQERAVMRDISASYTKLLMPGLEDAERERISLELKGYEDRLENLKREIRATSPAYSNLKYPEVITLEEALRSLDRRDTAYFAYSLGKTASYAFALVRGRLKIFPLPPREVLVRTVMDYRRVIADKDNVDFSLGRWLFDDLIKPGLEPDLSNLVIIADDVLHLLPFETLVTDTDDPPGWLVDDFAVSYIPSFSSLRELKRRGKGGSRPKDLLAFGNPAYGDLENPLAKADAAEETFQSDVGTFPRLKYAGREVRSVSRLFKAAKADVFQGNEASEDRLKSLDLTDYRILHFATHGVIDDRKPVRSSIILALDQDPREDGLLQMREILKLKLNADLITLSSCRTGLGQFIRGEGVESLNRAFFFAGASSVLMSLWSVNDEATYRLMERFYHHLRGSESIAVALQNAKREISCSEAMSHPFYWAGFVITGQADRTVFPRPLLNWIIVVAASGLSVIGLVLGRSKRSRRLVSVPAPRLSGSARTGSGW